MSFSLAGRTVLVTGASSGLGAHLAQVAACAGAQVVLAARRLDRLEALAAAMVADGHSARAVPLDVTDEASIAACVAAAGPLDVVVNNAGIAEPQSAVDVSADAFDRIVETNLRGCFLVATAAARSLIAAGRGGSIINIASILGMRVAGAVAPYAMSKAGVIQMTKALALEWARHGIRVNAIAPGYMRTAINDDFFASAAGVALIKRVPMRRLGELQELDGPFLLLASQASSFMTGSVIAVDGGHLVSSL
jgi:NAD(P)-dependent dehydrogenase (short-subunit alcohol dehydrogenase family)